MSLSRTGLLGPLLVVFALAACASGPVVFPAAEAETLADRSIAGIRDLAMPMPPQPLESAAAPLLDAASLEVNRLKTQMARRFVDLGPWLDSGAVGLAADGYLAIRDAAAVPPEAINTLRTVVANENADRAALYREIAAANRQGKWAGQIRGVFATRWIALAQPGWWYQDTNENWKQK